MSAPNKLKRIPGSIKEHVNQALQDSGVSKDDLSVKGCKEEVCQLQVKEDGKPEERKFENLDSLLSFANRWLKEHPGAANKRGNNSHPLFSRMQNFVLVDADTKPGADSFLFKDNNNEWNQFSKPEGIDVKNTSQAAPPKKIYSKKPIKAQLIIEELKISDFRSFYEAPRTAEDLLLEFAARYGKEIQTRSHHRQNGIIFGDEARFFKDFLSVALHSLSPEEFQQLESKFYDKSQDPVLFLDENTRQVKRETAYKVDLPLILATLEKLQAMDWKALGFPAEKLHPVNFMKSFYPFTVKKDPNLPDILTPFHEIHLAGHPEIKINWSDPYLMYCYQSFLNQAGLLGGISRIVFKNRTWIELEKHPKEEQINLHLYKSTGELERSTTISAAQPKAKGFQLTTPDDIKTQPFVLSVHGRSIKIFAPHANNKTKELINNWGRFLSYFPESFIPPVADRLIKKNSVSIELARDNQSFTIKWDNPIANALAGAYPVYLSNAQDFASIFNFTFQKAAETFPDDASKQKALRNYFIEDSSKQEVMHFKDNFWKIFMDFMNAQTSSDGSINILLPDDDKPIFHWLHLAKYFSDYPVDRIGNIAKADLFLKSTMDEMGQGFVPSEWEASANAESRASTRSARGTRSYHLPMGLGAQSHFRNSGTKIGPRLQTQLLSKQDSYALGLEGEYSWFRDSEVHQHQLGLLATFRLQKDIIPVEHHLMGGVAVWAGLSLGAQYLTAPNARISPLAGLQVGAQFYDKYSLAFDAQSNGEKGGTRLGLSLQINAAKW